MCLGNIKVIGELPTAGKKSDFRFPLQGNLTTCVYAFYDTLLIYVIFFTARHYASTVYAVVMCLSIRPSVCHTPVL